MKLLEKLVTVLILSGLSVTAQNVNINCVYHLPNPGVYTCLLLGIIVADNENQSFTIGGAHMSGRNNDDVLQVEIVNSDTPFIISQLFTTFSNMQRFIVTQDRGLRRIQTGAFRNATNLNNFVIHFNEKLRVIEQNSFTGASNVVSFSIVTNQIETIDDSAFNGLNRAQFVYLGMNQIRHLSENLLRNLPQLMILHSQFNSLHRVAKWKSFHSQSTCY